MARAPDKRPWKKILSYTNKRKPVFRVIRVLELECGHSVIRRLDQRVPKRARCPKCEEVE